MSKEVKIFAGRATQKLGEQIAKEFGNQYKNSSITQNKFAII